MCEMVILKYDSSANILQGIENVVVKNTKSTCCT
jgi:hypothetical protein